MSEDNGEYNNYKEKIINFLKNNKPSCTNEIQKICDIGNWNTTLKHCLELYIEKRISGIKSSRGWIFWKENIDKNEKIK